MPIKRKRGERHPIEYVAFEFGVDRKSLLRRIEAAGADVSKGVTFRQAFQAWTSKDQRDADRARQQKADADTAEVTAAEKQGKLMLKADARMIWADAAVEVRKLIQSQPKWESGKLLVALSKLKPTK